MARTYDALLRAERIRSDEPGAAADAELGERIASLEEGQRDLGRQLARDLAEGEERLVASLAEELRALEVRRTRAEQQRAIDLESRLEQLQRRGMRASVILGALLLWILFRL